MNENTHTRALQLDTWIDNLPPNGEELRERLDDCLARYRGVEESIQSFVGGTVDEARIAAQITALTIRYPDDTGRPALFGVPIAVKDIMRADGYETRAGSKLSPEEFAGAEASLVTRLREAGCIVFGKSVTTEFAYFQPGATRNPHNTAHTPGGSSSGSAAAVAAGIVPLALGTQTIGSVIRPASFCGITGYKPSGGLLPRDGVLPFSYTVDQLGFFSQDVRGMAAFARSLFRWEQSPREGGSAGAGAGPNASPRIGIVTGAYLEQADGEMQRVTRAAGDALREAGYEVVETDLFSEIAESIEAVNRAHRAITAREFYHVHARRWEQHGKLYSKSSRSLFEEGRELPVADYTEALDVREAAIGSFERMAVSEDPPLWISPAAPGIAPKSIDATGNPIMNLPWTFLGAPAVTVPAAWDQETGLPYGLQVTAPRFADDALLAHAEGIEEAVRTRPIR